MEALLEVLLIFIVSPLVAASFAKGSGASKFGFAILAGAMSMLGALASVFAGTVAGLVGIVILGGLACLIAATASGKTCPACRKRIHAKATVCPNCRSALQAGITVPQA